MLSSMTGFGRAFIEIPSGKLTVEIQSINRKYLEIFLSLPKEYQRFELEVRKWVSESISRGTISVRIFFSPNSSSVASLLPDPQILKAFKTNWEKIALQAGVDPKEIHLSFLMQYLPLQSKEELLSEDDLNSLRSCVTKALEALTSMKQMEGKALGKDLSVRLKDLQKMLEKIEESTPDAPQKMRKKLFERVQEILKMSPELEERLIREVALFAEKVDVSEEILRCKSHLMQFSSLLNGPIVGRKMDFLIQEIGREINTIGSKSTEAKISHLVVEMKSELEKIREQVQNIE